MNIYQLAGLIFSVGVTGGIVNCILVGAEKIWPGYDDKKIWHPGWGVYF